MFVCSVLIIFRCNTSRVTSVNDRHNKLMCVGHGIVSVHQHTFKSWIIRFIFVSNDLRRLVSRLSLIFKSHCMMQCKLYALRGSISMGDTRRACSCGVYVPSGCRNTCRMNSVCPQSHLLLSSFLQSQKCRVRNCLVSLLQLTHAVNSTMTINSAVLQTAMKCATTFLVLSLVSV